ncbi:hypothetical protein [Tunturiibacter gelidoferens]|uniref:Uncharacterized protein n=1 Tax=Tunturiibacter gelidiferens TaxID=3069689 RepID=A0ACC5P089_9BACT|nr:hypothetical protein [Edaphobacter lichenicola]MBB5340268.1 hypothetical protein [Edaphobacter lichenicola]
MATYESDAGGIDVLLYDREKNKVVLPDIAQIISTKLKQKCSIRISNQMGFDALSRVKLRLADNFEEGEDKPDTHCFKGEEEWVLDQKRSTAEQIKSSR